jgi:hypothetical protein
MLPKKKIIKKIVNFTPTTSNPTNQIHFSNFSFIIQLNKHRINTIHPTSA